MHLLPRMNVMIDFIWTLQVQLRGIRNKWTSEQYKKNLVHGRIRNHQHDTASRLQAHRHNHSATTRLIMTELNVHKMYIYTIYK